MSQTANTYNKVSVEPQIEAKIIGVLRKSGQPFRAVSRTEYYISKKQCDTLSKLNIPYTKLQRLSKRILQEKVKLHYKLPTNYNNGKPIPDKDIVNVKNFFVDRYGGLSVDSPSEGYWKEDGFVYKDTNLEFSILIPRSKFNREVKKEIQKHIEKFKIDFGQLAILCYYHDVVST